MLATDFLQWLSTALATQLPFHITEQNPLETHVKFPWILKFASIGDSYSAGLGAGDRIDWGCSRYAKAYPNILHTTLLGNDSERIHQFLSCSGATTTDILDNQVPALEKDLNLLTVSSGGNDIGLVPILSNCIYQFYMDGEESCQKAIQDAREKIVDKNELYANVTRLLNATIPKMNKEHGIIYLTGYAGFFGVEDEICDNVTWAVWRDIESEKQYLRLEMRQELNDLVRFVNTVLRSVAEAAGPIVRFIDYSDRVEEARGRYCEAGIMEPAPNRHELVFYEWNTVDTGENSTALLNHTGGDVPKGSFEGDIAERINKTIQEHPDWEFDPDKGFVNKTEQVVGEEGFILDTIHWLLPDSWRRVFHMRPEGHAIVAKMIVEDLIAQGSVKQRASPEIQEL